MIVRVRRTSLLISILNNIRGGFPRPSETSPIYFMYFILECDKMKNKKILAIILLIIIIVTLVVPFFSFSAFADDSNSSSGEFRLWNSSLDFSSLIQFVEYSYSCSYSVYNGANIAYNYSYFKIKYVSSGLLTNGWTIYGKIVDGDEIALYTNGAWINENFKTWYFYELPSDMQGLSFVDSNSVLNPVDVDSYYYQWGFSIGNKIGYDSGYNVAINDSQSLGDSLLGDTLTAPLKALQNFTLFTTSSGVNITLWTLFGAIVGFSLFIAFLKLYSGG